MSQSKAFATYFITLRKFAVWRRLKVECLWSDDSNTSFLGRAQICYVSWADRARLKESKKIPFQVLVTFEHRPSKVFIRTHMWPLPDAVWFSRIMIPCVMWDSDVFNSVASKKQLGAQTVRFFLVDYHIPTEPWRCHHASSFDSIFLGNCGVTFSRKYRTLLGNPGCPLTCIIACAHATLPTSCPIKRASWHLDTGNT